MSDKKNETKSGPSVFSSTASKAMDLLAAVRLFFVEIKETFLEHVDGMLRRVQYLFIVYLWVSVGVLLMLLGCFFLVIDYGQVPRGVVFSIGGALVFLIAVIFLQSARLKKSRK